MEGKKKLDLQAWVREREERESKERDLTVIGAVSKMKPNQIWFITLEWFCKWDFSRPSYLAFVPCNLKYLLNLPWLQLGEKYESFEK